MWLFGGGDSAPALQPRGKSYTPIYGSEENLLALIEKIQCDSFVAASSEAYEQVLLFLVGSSSRKIKLAALRTISLVVSPHSTIVPSVLAEILRILENCEATDPFITQALHLLSMYIDSSTFIVFKPHLQRLIRVGSLFVRRLCLLISYKVFVHHGIESNFLGIQLRRALFDPDMKLNVISILAELSIDHTDFVQPFIPLLEMVLEDCKSFVFSKICRIMARCPPSPRIDEILLNYVMNNPTSGQICDMMLMSRSVDSPVSFLKEVGKLAERKLTLNPTPNQLYQLCYALDSTKDLYQPREKIMRKLLASNDPLIKQKVIALSTFDDDETLQTMNSFILEVTRERSTVLVPGILKLSPRMGVWFATVIVNLSSLGLDGLMPQISETLLQLTDKDTIQMILNEYRSHLMEIPDTFFGRALSQRFATSSEDPEDFFLLISTTLSNKSSEHQALMLGCAETLWRRLEFQVDVVGMSRLMQLSKSRYREVHKRALLFIDSINRFLARKED